MSHFLVRAAKARERLRLQGMAGTVRKFWRDHVFRTTTSVMVEYRQGWRAVKAERAMPDDLEFRVVETQESLPPLCEWLAWREPAFRRMIVDGKTGLMILHRGIAVGCTWVSFADHVDRKAHEVYRVAPGEAYHYCWLVDPACRNSQIGLTLCRCIMQFLAERNITRQFGVVDLTNTASYVIQIFFGYRECGVRIVHYYILGTQWTRMTPYTGLLGPQRRSRQQLANAA